MTELHAPPRPGDRVFPPPSPDAEFAPAGSLPIAAVPSPELPAPAPQVPLVQPMTSEGYVVPSLPAGVAAVASPVDTPAAQVPAHHPSRAVLGTPTSLHAPASGTPVRASRRRSGTAPRSVALTLFVTVLAVAAGGAAHIGYERYIGDATGLPFLESLDDGDLTSWGIIDPPAVRYTDTVSTIQTGTNRLDLAVHLDLSNGFRLASATALVDGIATSTEVDQRGATAMARPLPDGAWQPVPPEQVDAVIGAEWMADVLTVSDVLPSAVLPHTTVLEQAGRQLPLGPIQTPTSPREVRVASATALGVAATPTDVWHYRVIIDVEGFRQADASAHDTWLRRLGPLANPRLELWVDGDGLVRQISLERDGASVTHTLVAAASASSRFDAPTIPATDAPDGE